MKGPIHNIETAKKCSNCGVIYHSSCAKRGKPNAKNVFFACCGEVAADNGDEADINELDNNSKILFKLLSKKIDSNREIIEEAIKKINSNILDIEDRLDTLEENGLCTGEDLIAEIRDRKSRENNFIIYNLTDTKNASATDHQTVVDLLSTCKDTPPFDLDNIIVSRLGNKFSSGNIRPLKVTLPSNEHVHWIFSQRKFICKNKITISADLTRKQREFLASIVRELKTRKNNGENDIFIKYIRGVPTIVKDKSFSKDNKTPSPIGRDE